MAKFRLMSDLHLETTDFQYWHAGEDVLVLAGDIHTNNRLHLLLEQVPIYVKVIFVAGNHEYYNEEYNEVNKYFKSLEYKNNFVFLNNQSVVVEGVPIYGGTMFTDFNLRNDAWFDRQYAKNGVADFTHMYVADPRIDGGVRVWTTGDAEHQHTLFTNGLADFLDEYQTSDNKLVVSHFMPSARCTNPHFAGNALNAYFASNMERFMGFNGVWLAGHGHYCLDTMMGDTRLIMNTHGYRYDNNFDPELIVEL